MLEQGVSLCDETDEGGREPQVNEELGLEQGVSPCGWVEDGGHRPPASVGGFEVRSEPRTGAQTIL
jgi:hypothetical protein